MFQGENAITVDAKGRMAIPTVFREPVAAACDNHLVVTYNPFEDGGLWLYPRPVWERVAEQVNALPKVEQAHRDLQRKLVGAAAMVEPDSVGRILLPAMQRSIAGIDKKAVLLGMDDKFEIWSEVAHMAKFRATIPEGRISEAMSDLVL